MHFYIPLYLKLVLPGTTYHADYITHANSLCVLKSSLSNYTYHINSQNFFYVLGYATVSPYVAIALSCALSMHKFHRNVTAGPLAMCG